MTSYTPSTPSGPHTPQEAPLCVDGHLVQNASTSYEIVCVSDFAESGGSGLPIPPDVAFGGALAIILVGVAIKASIARKRWQR